MNIFELMRARAEEVAKKVIDYQQEQIEKLAEDDEEEK